MDNKFTTLIQARLEGENLSSLAAKLGISRSLLHDWVKSERLPSLKNIEQVKKLSDYLGVSLEELFLGRKESTSRSISSIHFEDEGRQYLIKIEKLK